MEIHAIQADGTISVTDASHADVANDADAPLRRVLYSNGNHYDALVELLPNPIGWSPAWKQPLPALYFKEDEAPAPKAEEFQSLAKAAGGRGRKQPRFSTPKPVGKHAKKGKGKAPAKGKSREEEDPDAKPKKGAAAPAQYPVMRRCRTKTTTPPELRDDILTELCRIPVKPRITHPHQREENLIKDMLPIHCFRLVSSASFFGHCARVLSSGAGGTAAS